jgi:adenosylcobinamide-phosphate synthase
MDAAARFGILAAALLLDRLVGDPPALWSRLPHPVALVGRLIGWADRSWNPDGTPKATRRRRGAVLAALLVSSSLALGLLLQFAFAALPFGFVLEIVLVAVLLAQGSLIAHVRQVGDALAAEDLGGARPAVGAIVGREVGRLDESGVARAAIESLAENFSDGVVAPAFWYALLGLPGLLAYKAVNTADSMIGHRTPRHAEFGWAAARLDDLLNLLPARLSALLIALAALPRGGTGAALRAAWLDAPRHLSPNAGWPEAAMAGVLGLALGGPRTYEGRSVASAWLNEGGRRAAGAVDIRSGLRLVDGAWLFLLALALLGVAVSQWTAV